MVDLKRLAEFLVKAKRGTYASVNSMKIEPERPNHKELEFSEGEFYYRDSYVGMFQAPGMEEVRLGKKGQVIWTMAYSGGMAEEFHNNLEFAKLTFTFLKKALSFVDEKIPYRGPKKLEEGNFSYVNKVKGDIRRFIGHEKILFKGKEVFSQDYIGGLVI